MDAQRRVVEEIARESPDSVKFYDAIANYCNDLADANTQFIIATTEIKDIWKKNELLQTEDEIPPIQQGDFEVINPINISHQTKEQSRDAALRHCNEITSNTFKDQQTLYTTNENNNNENNNKNSSTIPTLTASPMNKTSPQFAEAFEYGKMIIGKNTRRVLLNIV